MSLETVSQTACFGGTQTVLRHTSRSTGTAMTFALFLPPLANEGPVPVLLFLSGLTCTWENVTTKAAAQAHCARHGLAFLACDTSPRGPEVPDDDAYDLGQGAGFYINATQSPWARHFRMEDYVIKDLLPALAASDLPVSVDRIGLTGHSMGGHGALTLAMKYPDRIGSLSAFAPIVNPADAPWGRKAFSAYLGADEAAWADHDACALMARSGWHSDILIDIGLADPFLERELTPERFEKACQAAGVSLKLRRHAGYDHSYYFIMTFMMDHVAWCAERLTPGSRTKT